MEHDFAYCPACVTCQFCEVRVRLHCIVDCWGADFATMPPTESGNFRVTLTSEYISTDCFSGPAGHPLPGILGGGYKEGAESCVSVDLTVSSNLMTFGGILI